MAGTDYSVYNPPINATNYPTLFTNFFSQLTTDVNAVEVIAADNAAYIAAISTTGFHLNDGIALTLGTGSDTTLSHSGTATNIFHTGTGDLVLINTSNSITIGDTLTSFSDNISASGNIALVVDNATLDIGASADLSLRHSGIASYITNNTGYLYIDNLDSASYTFLSSGTTPCISVGGPNNSANLLYGGASRLITTTAGIEVTGGITMDNGELISLGSLGTLDIWQSGSAGNISNGAGGLIIENTINSTLITMRTPNSTGLVRTGITIGGATPLVALSYDGSIKLSTASTGISVVGDISLSGGNSTISSTGILNLSGTGGVTADSIPINKTVSTSTSFPTGTGNITTLYTGIPTWARRVTIFINDLQFLLGLDTVFIRLGPASGTVSTGYNSIASSIVGLNSTLISNKATTYLVMLSGVSSTPEGYAGVITLDLIDETANTWMYTYMGNTINTQNDQHFASGKISLTGGNLERFSINLLDTPVNSRFTAGSFSVLIE